MNLTKYQMTLRDCWIHDAQPFYRQWIPFKDSLFNQSLIAQELFPDLHGDPMHSILGEAMTCLIFCNYKIRKAAQQLVHRKIVMLTLPEREDLLDEEYQIMEKIVCNSLI